MRSVLLLLAVVIASTVAIREQAVHVKGRLLCGTSPARNVKVKLWDEDDGNALFGKFHRFMSTALI